MLTERMLMAQTITTGRPPTNTPAPPRTAITTSALPTFT